MDFFSNCVISFEDLDITGNIFQIELYVNPLIRKTFFISAFDEGEAIDRMVNLIEEKMPGLIFSDNEVLEIEKEGSLSEFIYGGNHCLYLCIEWSDMELRHIYQRK